MVDLVASINSVKSMLPNYDQVSSFATRGSKKAPANVHGERPRAGRSVRKLNINDLAMQLTDPSLIPFPEVLKPKKGGEQSGLFDLMGTEYKIPTKLGIKSETLLRNAEQAEATKSFLKSDLFKDMPSMKLTKQELETRKKLLKSSLKIPANLSLKKTDATINALNRKISNKKALWQNEQFGWDGYHYHSGKAGDSVPSFKDKRNVPKSKLLEEMSNKFRESLSIKTDMSLSIPSPTLSDHGLLQSPHREGARSGVTGNKLQRGPANVVSSESNTTSSEEALSSKGNPIKKPLMGKELSQQSIGKKKATGHSMSAEIVQLKSLLHGTSSGESTPQSNMEASQTMSYDELKQIAMKLGQTPRQPQLQLEKHTAVKVAATSKTPMVMSENFHDSGDAETKSGTKVQQLVQERIQESIKSTDEAAMVAKRLGTLLTKLNMSKGSDNARARSMKDTVDLAKELRELAKEMEKEYGLHPTASKPGQTQTEKLKSPMPQIQFTKQMSYTDQLVLRKLREIRDVRTKATGEAINDAANN